jgi:transcriptional regulator with XRE-family HTH domain
MRRRKPDREIQYTSPTFMDIVNRIAANVRARRAELGLTQPEAAARCGMRLQLYQAVEGARRNVTVTTLARLCDGLGMDVRNLFDPAPPIARRGPGRPRERV